MSDAVYSGIVSDLKPVIQEFPANSNTFMILEKLPTCWIEFDRHQPDSGLKFARLNINEDFGLWGRGRIFNHQAELRWEQTTAGFQVVYIGSSNKFTGLGVDSALSMAETDQKEVAYYLWGQQMSKEQLEDIHWDTAAADIFVELQTPCLLRYPVEAGAGVGSRLKLQVVEYYNQPTGQLVIYRMKGVEAA